MFMCVKDVVINNQVGLHARPATFFIQKANEFKSTVWVEKEERRVNAKSLLGVLSLGIVGGTEIRIIVDGSDEEAALSALVELVESGFGESYPFYPAGVVEVPISAQQQSGQQLYQ
jgi:phosphocarrier protein